MFFKWKKKNKQKKPIQNQMIFSCSKQWRKLKGNPISGHSLCRCHSGARWRWVYTCTGPSESHRSLRRSHSCDSDRLQRKKKEMSVCSLKLNLIAKCLQCSFCHPEKCPIWLKQKGVAPIRWEIKLPILTWNFSPNHCSQKFCLEFIDSLF